MKRMAILLFLYLMIGMVNGEYLPSTWIVPFTYLALLTFHIILEYETKKEFRPRRLVRGAVLYAVSAIVLVVAVVYEDRLAGINLYLLVAALIVIVGGVVVVFRDYVKKEISGAFDYVYGIAVLLWPVYAYLAQLGKS